MTERINSILSQFSPLNDVFVVGYARTPIGEYNGSLSSLSATQLGAHSIIHALRNAGIAAEDFHRIDQVLLGNVLSANLGQAPARQAALLAGLPDSIPCTTVNKICSSGMKTINLMSSMIRNGEVALGVCGGFESMSNVPFYVSGNIRRGHKMGDMTMIDGMIKDGLWDVYNDYHMGEAAELCSSEHNISREEQDKYAELSFERSVQAQERGLFHREIAPILVKLRRKEVLVDHDEGVKALDINKFRRLKSVFVRDGSVTAGNASNLSDGAACVILASRAMVEQLSLKPIAKVLSYADAAQKPERFTTAPALAIPKALAMAKLSLSDVSFYEINEAFSVVALANMRLLGLPVDKVNVWGGSVAMGHPLGCSGARIVCTLLSVLEAREGRYGCAGICNGGGGASALVVERIQ